MHYFSLDYLIVYAFLLTTLVVGLWAGRGIKDIREYALANRQFGTVALTLTYLATDIGGAAILDWGVALAYAEGIIYALTNSGVIISHMFIAFVVAPRMMRFSGCMTLGDVMKSLYGKYSGILVGVISFVIISCMTAMELVILGVICESILGIKASWGMVLGGMLFSAYTAHGGIKSVTITDVLQFLVFIVGIPLLAYSVVEAAGGMQHIWATVPRTSLLVVDHEKFSYYLPLFLIWTFLPIVVSSPIAMQRMLMAQHPRQLRNQFLVVGVFESLLRWILLFIGLAALALFPQIAPNNAVAHMIHHLLPVGAKGVVIAALVSVNMSSLDSLLHIAGLTVVHDVIKPICDLRRIAINELRWVRWATVLVSAFVISIALYARDALQLFLVALSFQAPTLLCPILAGILGLKVDRRDFYISFVSTLLVFGVLQGYMPATYGHLSLPILIAANTLTFLGAHLIRNRGFVMRDRERAAGTVWQQSSRAKAVPRVTWRAVFAIPQRIVAYSQTRAKKYGAPYVLLGVFISMIYTLPYFLWSFTPLGHQASVLTIRFVGATLCALLIVKDKWPQFLLPYLPTFWHFTLLYCLPFTSTVMFLLTGGSVEWLVNIAITILFLVVLVDWVSFTLLSGLGVSLGLIFYRIVIGPISLQLDFSTGYLLTYQVVFATLIGLLFARRRQRQFDQISTQNEALAATNQEQQTRLLASFREKIRIIQTLQHAGIRDLLQVVKLTKEMRVQARAQVLPLTETATKLEATLIPMALQLRSIEAKATNFLRLSIARTGVRELCDALQAHLVAKGHLQAVQYHIPAQVEAITGDPQYLQQLLISSMTTLQVDREATHFQLHVEDTQLRYALPSIQPDYVKQVAALRFTVTSRTQPPALLAHYTAFMNDASLSTPETAQELVLLENKRIVQAHYGYMHATADTFSYVLPADLQEVRPKDLDAPHMELGAVPVRADDQYPGAQAQEQAFLEEVRTRSQADLDLIRSVIELIKWYHGPTKRKTGEPFYLHPLAVAQIVLDYNQEEATLLAALLHDTVEDTALLLSDVKAIFGKDTAGIVDTVTHLESKKDSLYKIKLSAEENILMLLEAGDDRAVYVKLADRLHNMRTIEGKSSSSQVRIAKETLQFFVPQARRLGLDETAEELKKRSWEVLEKQRI